MALECSLADPDNCFNDDCQYGSFKPEQQRSDERHLAPKRVDVTQRHNADDAGKYEQAAGYETANRPMHEPADVSGKLLRLGAWQQHAVVQRMEKPLLGNPSLLLDEDTMHDGDLSGRSAKAQERNSYPGVRRLFQ